MDTPTLINELLRDEGLRLYPYTDSAGKITIGCGRNLTDNGISREEAYQFLNHDLDNVFADLDQFLPWWRRLNDARQRVLANLAFNLGIRPPKGKLLTFKHTLALMQAGFYSEAADALLNSHPWREQVGPRADRLAEMMRVGLTAV